MKGQLCRCFYFRILILILDRLQHSLNRVAELLDTLNSGAIKRISTELSLEEVG